MARFKNSLFLRLNDQEIIDNLINMGYQFDDVDGDAIMTVGINEVEDGVVTRISTELFDTDNPYVTYNRDGRIDCGTDLERFYQLAAELAE